MINEQNESYNLDRSHRALKSRKHLLAFYYFITGAATIWLIIGLLAVGVLGLKGDSFSVVSALVAGIVLPIILLLLGRFVLFPAANTRVEIKDDRLIIRRFDDEVEIPFSDVIKIELSYLPFVAGWMKLIIKDKPSQTLSVAIERSEYILDVLLNHNARLADASLAQNYRRTAIYYDHSWARFNDRFNSRNKLMIKYLLTSLILTVAFFALRINIHSDPVPTIYQVLLFFVATVLFMIVISGLLWLISETFILAPISRRRLKIDASKPLRPIDLERRVEYFTNFCFLFIAITCLMILI
jgi:hypothetical protein